MPEIVFDEFLGIHTGKTKPPRNSAGTLENFDLRGLSGALESRTGYGLLHDSRPDGEGLSNRDWLKLENIYIPDVGGGQEIQLVVGNAVATSVQNADATFQKDVFCVWASHVYSGSTYDTWLNRATSDGWDWLNETIFTTVKAVHGTDLYKIKLDINNATWITDNKFLGYSVVNLDTNEVYKIIKCFDYTGSDDVGLYISSINHSFAVGNKLALMRSYLPIEYVEGNSEATAADISFCKVLNDVKIGFGGYENRCGLTVGYRKSYLQIKKFDFYAASDAELEAFAMINGLICSPHTALFEDASTNASEVSGGDLDADTYYLRLTCLLDGLSEILLAADSSIITAGSTNLSFDTKIKLGTENLRLTEIKDYLASNANLVVYQYFNYVSIREKEFNKRFSVDNSGYISIAADTDEIHSPLNDNAASTNTTTDPLSTTGWVCATGISAVADTGAGSINVIKLQWTGSGSVKHYAIYPNGSNPFQGNTVYTISLYLKSDYTLLPCVMEFGFVDSALNAASEKILVTIDNTWKTYTFEILTDANPSKFLIRSTNFMTSATYIRFDRLSIKKQAINLISADLPERGNSIAVEAGYTPTLNLVKSWDRAKLSEKVFMVNAYINERNLNKIFFSHISGNGANMWDAINATGYYNTENSDGNDLRGIEILRNYDILSFNTNSNARIEADTGRKVDLGIGSGVENIDGVVNIGSKILYPGKYDILETDSVNTNPVSFRTISEKYRALTTNDKANLRAVREENKNSYRLYLGNATSKEEVIYTPFGWQSSKRNLIPECYALNRSGNVYFMNDGYVYFDQDGNGDNQVAITSKWKSIPLNRELLDEIPANSMILITDFWVLWFGTNQLQINLYLDYSGTAYDSQTLSPVGSTITTYKRPVKLSSLGPASAQTIELELVSSPTVGYGGGKGACTVLSAGILFEIIPGTLHA